ncbi:MAG: type II toxin-antitoxin system prevent-host-death family antitoxin [Leptospirales bacterium]|nr:type II toxin-antitoxin system prevent-host-death family antitoxin [Leptospirales bacterium]
MAQQQIGTFEAKTHFSKIIEEVERGADYVITKRGKPVAKLIPFQQQPEMTRREALEKIKEVRKRYHGKSGDFNIREAIEEGRR